MFPVNSGMQPNENEGISVQHLDTHRQGCIKMMPFPNWKDEYFINASFPSLCSFGTT